MHRLHRALPLVVFLCAGCGDDAAAEPPPEQGPPRPAAGTSAESAPQGYGFEVWYDDFPEQPRLSPPRPGQWYDRSRRGTLEAVAANLSGLCSREAWLFAKEFFMRVPLEDTDVLVETLDRGLQADSLDVVETTLTAMGRVGDPRFAPAILRALKQRRRKGVETAACRSLATCATPEDVLEAGEELMRWHGAAQVFWFEAAVRILEPGVAAARLREALAEPRLGSLRVELVKKALELPPVHAAAALRDYWNTPPEGVEATMVGLRHAAADGAAAAMIRDLLDSEAPSRRVAGLSALRFGDPTPFRSRILELTTDPDERVRQATFDVLDRMPGEETTAALESLALDEVIHVRQGALRRLVELGRTALLEEIVDEVRTATGSGLDLRIADLVFAGYAGAIPVIAERMRAVPDGEQRPFLQAIAHLKARAGFPPLRDVFLAEPVDFGRNPSPDSALESRTYVALLFVNLIGAERDIVELFESLDRADYGRRGRLLSTLASIAVDRDDPEIAKLCYDALRRVVQDRDEIPQMRLLALNYLVRGLDLDDVAAIRRLARDEDRAMQRALNDFLLEYL